MSSPTELECKKYKSKDVRYKLYDEGGLYLLVYPNGSKYQRLKHRYVGKEKLVALGVYPDVFLRKLGANEMRANGLLFPCVTNPLKEMSDNTLSKVLRVVQGYQGKANPHGMRETASTILNESGFRADVIERQLVYCERNKVRTSYNHAQYLHERCEMMDWWGNYVEKIEENWI